MYIGYGCGLRRTGAPGLSQNTINPHKHEPHSPGARHSLWYKDAIVYELHVRTFHDSDGDGIGDFAGLTEKLDYLQDLGITAIWLWQLGSGLYFCCSW